MRIRGRTNKALLWGTLILFFTFAPVNGAIAQTCIQPPEGLVSWWPGDGNAHDIQDGNHGALVNGATTAPGKVGEAFSLDGVDDYISVPDAENLNFGPTSPMTIELWVFRTSTAPAQHILGKRVGCGTNDGNYQMAVDPFYGGLIFNNTTSDFVVAPGVDLPLNTWTHLAVTFDGSFLRFYINGALAATSTGPGTLGPIVAAPFTLGTSGTCHLFGQGFGGLLDEVEIYNRALSASEIQAIFNAGSAGKCKVPSAQCEQQLVDAQTQLAQLQAQVAQLQQQVQHVESQLMQLTTTLATGLDNLQNDLRIVFADPTFVIPGATPLDQYQNLITAILNLNQGRKIGIFVGLGGTP